MPNAEDLARLRRDVVQRLREQYLGPAGGDEETTIDRPDRVYLVGTLYPRGPIQGELDGDTLGEDGHDEALDEPIELANAWHPASAAISFLHDGDELDCDITASRYERTPEGRGWRRVPLLEPRVSLTAQDNQSAVLHGAGRVVSVWRRVGDRWLVTVAIENAREHDNAESDARTEDCLFQVSLRATVVGGEVHPYPSVATLSQDPEDEELELHYRAKRVYGVGHGCSVGWGGDGHVGPVTWVETEMLPTVTVPGISPGPRTADVLRLSFLMDESRALDALQQALSEFVSEYEEWVGAQISEAAGLDARFRDPADRVTRRMERAVKRMQEGISLLSDRDVLTAFRLANRAMREQILQTNLVRAQQGRRGKPLPPRDVTSVEPAWYPFQLAFQLLTLPSVVDADHADRNIVDLIWFPTGGGKTEAYLAVAAFEMIHRRLTMGLRGGGTAVITRYTLRMLTSQQFQRAATLICALELIRRDDERLEDKPEFSIGLWVGSPSTPNTYEEAFALTRDLLDSGQPSSPFQITACPWCGTPMFPSRRSADRDAYGVKSTRYSFELLCTHAECPFASFLPVLVVDEQIFANPPTMLVATVDKFARVPWVAASGAVFGRSGVPYAPPSLIIQDELHLLSGPLGTTVALYEAAIIGLIGWDGRSPKIIASTATIRSASEQVRRIYGSDVALFPPSGLSADDSYFARVDPELPGRLYMGLMPQAHTQSYATVLACVALLEIPTAVVHDPESLDAYWTLVAYHNSLRELGRTVTIARDDVDNMLRRRSDGNPQQRLLRRDGVVELTSNVDPRDLVQFMRRLERPVGDPECVDLVATTNMLSVGIDIGRLGLMLMNGQPKTTAEYIQATSRVGRSEVPGLVVTLLRANKPRDRSHYESYRSYHESIYRHVEPTSVTPWSLASRDRSLHAALVILMRHGAGLNGNADAAQFSAESPLSTKAVSILERKVELSEPEALAQTAYELRRLVADWQRRVQEADSRGLRLLYESSDKDHPALLCDFGVKREGWPTMHSMRSVDRQVRVIAIGEQRT
jgi:hypothetical protein